MINTQTIETYIAQNNPDDVLTILREAGTPKPKNMAQMIDLLHQATQKYPDTIFPKLAEIETPYYQLIMSKVIPVETPKHSNCSGCSSCSGKSNASGDATSSSPVTAATTAPTTISPSIPFKAPTFINEHPIPSAVIGTVLFVVAIVGIVKLLK